MMSNLLAVTPHVTIRSISVSAMDNNVYLLTAATTGFQVLIDAADDLNAISMMVREAAADAAGPILGLVVTTHSHADHLRALAPLVAATEAPVLAGAEDVASIESQTGITVERGLNHGDRINSPGLSLEVIGLRGHTPGSVALAYQEPGQPVHLFTGDSLFPGGVGNTDGDPERFNALITDVQQHLFDQFDDAAIVHPGHGPATTLGAERPHLAEWWERGW
ncbi:MAG: MBL fold metallo-hydrolase [Bifidobacteriaceae bacterium]|jgi:glyoxylase-like metal-dependent hydrolase (beta-lactamase superfamily II)|nr:MBL fold metallo-hydrolase [Bifidobacteriaceae bacterium]